MKCSGSDDELEALFNSNSAYSHLDIDTARMIEAFFDINISSQPEGQEEINMCNAIAQMKEKSHMKGLEEGRMEGREEGRMKGLEEGREEERADLTARLVRSLMTENDSLTEEAAREKAFKMLGLE